MKQLTIPAFVLALCVPAAAQEAAELDAHHAHLKAFVGNWNAVAKFNTGQDGEAEATEGQEKVKLAKGGFWIMTEFKGKAADIAFLGNGIMTYDLKKKKYVYSWVDTMSSAMTVYSGTCAGDGKTIALTGKTEAPELGGDVTMKLTFTAKDENSRTLVIGMVGPDGNDIAIGTIDYVRAEKKRKKDKKPADDK